MLLNRWYEPKKIEVSPFYSDPSKPLSFKDYQYVHETHKDWLIDEYENVLAIRWRHYIDGVVVDEYMEPIR